MRRYDLFNCHVTSHEHMIKRLCIYMDASFQRYVTTIASLVAIDIVVVDICFWFMTWFNVTTRLRVMSLYEFMALFMWTHVRSTPYNVWCPLVKCKWRYNIINLLRELTRPRHWRIMWCYGWELLIACLQRVKFAGYRHCGNAEIMF